MIKKCQIVLLVLGIALFGANAPMAQITSSIDTYVGQLDYQYQTLTKKSAVENAPPIPTAKSLTIDLLGLV